MTRPPDQDDLHDAAPFKSYQTMLRQEIAQAKEELGRPKRGLLISGFSAGLGAGVSLFLLAVVWTHGGEPQGPYLRLLAASAYSVGFILVILGRMDLFTEYTTIAILPVMGRQATLRSLARLWALVYIGNLAGAALLAWVAVLIGPELGAVSPAALVAIAHHMTDHAWWVILVSATLAGWLMGLLSWLITGGRDTISQIGFIYLVAATIGLLGLHHAIVGAAEVVAGLLAGHDARLRDLLHFLLWTTVGNAIGGIVFAASVHYSLHMRSRREDQASEPPRRS